MKSLIHHLAIGGISKPWRLPLPPIQSLSSRIPAHLLLQVSVPLSWLHPGLTQSWCHCLCQALVLSCAFDSVLPWGHLKPSLMRLSREWDEAYTSPVWGFFLQAYCYKCQQVCSVKEMEEEAPGAFQPYPLITSINLGPIIGPLATLQACVKTRASLGTPKTARFYLTLVSHNYSLCPVQSKKLCPS